MKPRASHTLDTYVERFPVLARISAAKRLRDLTETTTRRSGKAIVTAEHVEAANTQLRSTQAA